MFKKICAATLLFFFVLIQAAAPAAAQEPPSTPVPLDTGFPDISANAAILYSVDTDTIVYEKNADDRIHPASTTKILAVALAMELCDDLDNTIVTVPEGVWSEFMGMNISHADLKAGEQLSMRVLLNCMIVQSANEAAVALAAHYGRETFLRLMNEKAAELGCTGSYFSNPHGAFVDNHYTTARDMLLITKWALSIPGFWEMSQQARYYKEATNLSEGVTLVTTNYMQDQNSRYYTSYIKGIKTGTLNTAGRCLVSAAVQNGNSYLCLVFGAPMESTDRIWPDGMSSFTDTKIICDWAFQTLEIINVVDTAIAVTEIGLRHAADRDTLLLYPDGSLFAVNNTGNEAASEVSYEYDLPDSVKAPVSQGDVIGTANVYYGGRHVGQVNLISREDVGRSGFMMFIDTMGDILSSAPAKIIYIVILLFVLFYLFYMLIWVPRAQKKRKRKKRK